MFATSPYTDTVMTPETVVETLQFEPSDGLIWVVGPVLAVVFIICIVIAILLYKKWVGLGIIRCCGEGKTSIVQPQMMNENTEVRVSKKEWPEI